jgi:uncharacterized protein (TIGR02001 family)
MQPPIRTLAVPRLFGPALLVLALASPPARAQAPVPSAEEDDGHGLGGSVALLSDYVYYGVSQSQHQPALQFDLEYVHAGGLYAGVFASRVDFTAAGTASDGVSRETSWRAGWRPAVDGWGALDLSIERVTYPGAHEAGAYDYTEFGAALQIGEHATLHVAHNPDYFGYGAATTNYGLDLSWAWDAWGLDVSGGYFDQHDLVSTGYSHVDVSAWRQVGALRGDIGWSRTFAYSAAIAELNGEARLARPQLRVGVAFDF